MDPTLPTQAWAPGKVMVCGEYAVLEGFPALVLGVDRRARAWLPSPEEHKTLPPETLASLELLAATLSEPVDAREFPAVETSEQVFEGRKLGLGSSAAACVAALGLFYARKVGALSDTVRTRLVELGREGHRRAQGGGSGVDVVASVWGALSRVQLPEGPTGLCVRTEHHFPEGLHWRVLWTGVPVRTSVLLAAVHAWKARDPKAHGQLFQHFGEVIHTMLHAPHAQAFVAATREHHRVQAQLGQAAQVAIVTEAMHALDILAREHDCAIKPSGAGGGDIVLALGTDPDRLSALSTAAEKHGFTDLQLKMDGQGLALGL